MKYSDSAVVESGSSAIVNRILKSISYSLFLLSKNLVYCGIIDIKLTRFDPHFYISFNSRGYLVVANAFVVAYILQIEIVDGQLKSCFILTNIKFGD